MAADDYQYSAPTVDVVTTAKRLAPLILAAREEGEQIRRVPPRVAKALAAAGLLQMFLPRSMGGPELDPLTQFRVIEALAMAEGSVGWCAMIGSDGGYVTAFLDQDVARTMYPDLMIATGAAATATGP